MEVHILASGSDGNCTVLRDEDCTIMIDQGLSYKAIYRRMADHGIENTEIDCILVTHEHGDHIKGVGPTARRFDCPVMMTFPTFVASKIDKIDYQPISKKEEFKVGNFSILPIPTSHDAADPVCFRISSPHGTVTLATDTGKMSYMIEHALSESDIAIVESNYDKEMLETGPYPYVLKKRIDSDIGHMSNVASAEAIRKTMKDNRQVFLAHLSKTNNEPDIARETVSKITGIKRYKLDCLEFFGDTRVLRC